MTQQDIANMVDITSASKHFNLLLDQFGPYRIDYSRNGKHLLLAGRRGHIASMDWQSKKLHSEINVMETVNDVSWLHTHTMFAVAQKKWLYIYDNHGVELHCIKSFNDVLRMEFLPYHFLLATCSSKDFLQYLDVSVGKQISSVCVRAGRLNVMCQNPHNAIIHLGHHNGTVSLWSPTMKDPIVKMLSHAGPVRALSVDKTGTYMASTGTDKKLKIFDLRMYNAVTTRQERRAAGSLCYSQRGLLAVGTGHLVQVYKDPHLDHKGLPYLYMSVKGPVDKLQFCPYEDVLGIGHGRGFTSMIVPGQSPLLLSFHFVLCPILRILLLQAPVRQTLMVWNVTPMRPISSDGNGRSKLYWKKFNLSLSHWTPLSLERSMPSPWNRSVRNKWKGWALILMRRLVLLLAIN
ncbi:hypothetical protein GDO78_021235 [Eleutherodactylus coqui]|uniref:WD repeat-containing protein 46 n=1 Tax=Eleutherodactylus coqui TaxID=57060 RepID=A0A8J6EMD1_ELECQ|nr:hypothetical protein GDO78_021235 [Eleutherodactylus coqui]